MRHAGGGGGHAVLADAEMDVPAAVVAGGNGGHPFHQGQVRSGQVGGATEQFRRRGNQCFQAFLTGGSAGEFGPVVGDVLLQFGHRFMPVIRQAAGHDPLELTALVVPGEPL